MPSVEQLIPWATRLTNLDPDRTRQAVGELRSWNLEHLTQELLDEPDLDTVIAAVLLVEGVDGLHAQGAERAKLMKKIRDARSPDQLWSTWAEIRGASALIDAPQWDVRLELEPDRAKGRHSDFRAHFTDGYSLDIEFKAVGLSDAEVDWHRRAGEQFESLLPPVGLSTAHGWLDQPIRVSQGKRKRAFKGAKQLAQQLDREGFAAWAQTRGIAVVGRETEPDYLRRVKRRVESSLGQLAPERECLVGLWWGNGAPARASAGLLDEIDAPANVSGLIFIGQAVAVPWSEISVFIASLDRYANSSDREVNSDVDDHLATLVLDRFESSAGMRPTLLRSGGKNGMTLLRRDGRRRLLPFNLLFDSDPRALAAPHRPPSPVQDTRLMT